ncbi:KilA-N domain-containing protein [Asaia sp. HumB]|uniref:KilA-N domain-containing protein n=1 Tax=Asaia sp. HumB TaxID=3035475 RepID=UPI0025557BD4|nr:KilA-N domain-containing protein [Asaia sp. HumB]MDL2169780.1 KilA-N domain-containing protein [Asaia sp. HumB]
MTDALTILETKIRRDIEGRYCLNDCHRAAGGAKKDGPSYYLATEGAKKLVAEMEGHTDFPVGPTNIINDGKNNGTYVAKELVYAYAMWISPSFNLKVIQAFDALMMGNTPKVSLSRNAQLRSAVALLGTSITFNRRMGMDLQQARIKALAKVEDETGVDLAKTFGWTAQIAPQQVETLTPTQIGQRLGIGPREANQLLKQAGLQVDSRDAKNRISWAPTDNGLSYARLEDLSKAHTDGTTQAWRWYPKVVDFLRPFSRPKEAAS